MSIVAMKMRQFRNAQQTKGGPETLQKVWTKKSKKPKRNKAWTFAASEVERGRNAIGALTRV
jgi:hypothetical protein